MQIHQFCLIVMNISEHRIVTLISAFLLFFSNSSFSVAFSAGEDVIWEAGVNVYFKYADQDKSNFGKNDHPVELNAAEIRTVLESLKLREKDKVASDTELKSVFSNEQANMLSRYLSQGLKNARPGQDIIFAIEKSVPRSFFLLKPNRFFIAGRAFYKDNKLNIIIGEYDRRRNDAYETIYDPTHVGSLRYHLDHGRRSKSSKGFDKAIVMVDGVEIKQLNGTRREDWFVIDVQAASEAYHRMTRVREQEETESKRKELQELLGSEETARPVKRPRSLGTLEERLTILERLKDKGLITDEEYARKRKEMLDEL